jgi:hypothetical protein
MMKLGPRHRRWQMSGHTQDIERAPDRDPEDRSPGFEWDKGWDIDPEAFACGIDFSVPI